VLDQLVPPPGGALRRAALWVAFLAVAIGVTWAWTSGTVTPRLGASGPYGFGGDGPVYMAISVRNGSPVDIELTDGPRPRPGLRLIGYTHRSAYIGGSDSTLVHPLTPEAAPSSPRPFPIRIPADRMITLVIWYDALDCEAIAQIDRDDRDLDLQVKIADGPLSLGTRTRRIPLLIGSSAPSDVVGQNPPWPIVMAQHACGWTGD
jgi:hypothetical protein